MTYILLFAISIFVVGRLFWHVWQMNQNVVGKYAGFLGLFCLFMPSQYSQVGNHHRRKAMILIPIIVVVFVALYFMQTYLGIGQ